MSSIKEKTLCIERFARELGFDGFGVTGPNSAEAVKRYKDWLALGYEGEMAYMSRNVGKRSDLEAVLSGIKSIVRRAQKKLEGAVRHVSRSHLHV